jgi:regulatory protein
MMKNNRREKNSGQPLTAALDILARRSYTALELTSKLRERGFGAEETAETLTCLLERRYIDDADYARRYCRVQRERRSRRRIEEELRRRGVEKEIVSAALAAEYPPEQEFVNCLRALRQKGADSAAKTAAALYRQGYAERHIRPALTSLGIAPE